MLVSALRCRLKIRFIAQLEQGIWPRMVPWPGRDYWSGLANSEDVRSRGASLQALCDDDEISGEFDRNPLKAKTEVAPIATDEWPAIISEVGSDLFVTSHRLILTEDKASAAVVERCQDFVNSTGIVIYFGGRALRYLPSIDCVCIPIELPIELEPDSYYAVVLHELVHWTGHERRLKRDLGSKFGDRSNAAEELVAELASLFLCAELGIEHRVQHPECIDAWLSLLKDQHDALDVLAEEAVRATEYLRRRQ